MSSRVAEKERRKQERLEVERELADRERRHRRLSHVLSAVGALALVAGVAALVVIGRGGSSGSTAQAKGPFGGNYAGLDARRSAAGVPTMMDTMNSNVHFHPRVAVELDGKAVPVPANLGIDPSKEEMQMAGLHTHDPDGTIHVEGVAGPTLGQFFAVWGVPLSADRFGPYRGATVRVLVDGKTSREYGKLKLADQQQIKVVVTRGKAA